MSREHPASRFIASFLLAALSLFLPAGRARADDGPSPDVAATSPDTKKEDPNAEMKRRLDELERKNAQLSDEVQRLREDHSFVEQRVEQLMPSKDKISGYVDFGFFWVQGNGSGIRPDTGNERFPEYKGIIPDSWVFMGDPLATTINSRGEPADLNGSRAITFDQIKSGGKPSFILNSVNLAMSHGVGSTVSINASIDFVPRSRNVSIPSEVFVGDYIDVKLGYLQWTPETQGWDIALQAGKFDSVLGIEYRSQDAPDRLSVTPSLLCRYTCGRPLGLKARARFRDEKLIANVAVTNGSSFVELFPLYNEIDTNTVKTVSARLSYKIPIKGQGLEVGASGAYGAQDLQPDDGVAQWHIGADARLEYKDLDVRAEYVQGQAKGATSPGGVKCDTAQCLEYKAAYGLVGYRLTNWLEPYGRADWRNAMHTSGASFVYISKVARGTMGLRFEIGANVILKAEYTFIRELGRLLSFPDDVLTTSAVMKF